MWKFYFLSNCLNCLQKLVCDFVILICKITFVLDVPYLFAFFGFFPKSQISWLVQDNDAGRLMQQIAYANVLETESFSECWPNIWGLDEFLGNTFFSNSFGKFSLGNQEWFCFEIVPGQRCVMANCSYGCKLKNVVGSIHLAFLLTSLTLQLNAHVTSVKSL